MKKYLAVGTMAVAIAFSTVQNAAADSTENVSSTHYPEKSSPQTSRTLIREDSAIKAWKTRIVKGAPLKLHRHDCPRLIIALKGGKLESRSETGKVLYTRLFEEGESYWLEADPAGQLHYCENIGDSDIEVVVVEVKK